MQVEARLKECQAICRHLERILVVTGLFASSSRGICSAPSSPSSPHTHAAMPPPRPPPTESQLQQSEEWKQKGNVAFRAKSVPDSPHLPHLLNAMEANTTCQELHGSFFQLHGGNCPHSALTDPLFQPLRCPAFAGPPPPCPQRC